MQNYSLHTFKAVAIVEMDNDERKEKNPDTLQRLCYAFILVFNLFLVQPPFQSRTKMMDTKKNAL